MRYINEIPVLLILITMSCYILIRYYYIKRHKARVRLFRELMIILFIAYTETLLYLTLFPSVGTVTTNMASINLIPFQTISLYINFQGDFSLQVINLLGNIVVFLPIGIFAVFLCDTISFRRILIIGFGSTFFIEIMQLILSINGIISRSFDVDDLLLNLLGVVIGYYVGLFIKRFTLR